VEYFKEFKRRSRIKKKTTKSTVALLNEVIGRNPAPAISYDINIHPMIIKRKDYYKKKRLK